MSIHNPIQQKWETSGIDYEINFWDNHLKTQGGPYKPEGFQFKLSPDSWLQNEVQIYLKRGFVNKILDVGAGPLSHLGKRSAYGEFELFPIDALADLYDPLLEKYGIFPPVRTMKLKGEDILDRFGQNYFDIAFCRNALDHTVEPVNIFHQMIETVKPNGHIVLEHFIREGSHNNWEDFHSWDFHLENGDFIITGMDKDSVNLTQKFQDQISCVLMEEYADMNPAIRVVFQKK